MFCPIECLDLLSQQVTRGLCHENTPPCLKPPPEIHDIFNRVLPIRACNCASLHHGAIPRTIGMSSEALAILHSMAKNVGQTTQQKIRSQVQLECPHTLRVLTSAKKKQNHWMLSKIQCPFSTALVLEHSLDWWPSYSCYRKWTEASEEPSLLTLPYMAAEKAFM